VRRRQTKGAATDMFDLQPPRHISTLRILPIPARSGGGRLTERTPAAQPRRRERVKVPQTGPLSAPNDEIECLVERSALSSSNKRTQAPMEPIDDGAMNPVSISVRKPLNRTPLAMQKCPIHRG
jgi:hypothetical protein